MPPWTMKEELSVTEKRCSARICGVQDQRFPEYEKAGMAREAMEVGARGAMKSVSCPPIREVLAQSKRTVAVRRRMMPKETPLGWSGKPPAKSNCTSALVRAPVMVGPNAWRPICDWRREAPKVPSDSSGP